MALSWLRMSACELGQAIETGRISPLELTQCYLNAIDKHPMAHRIYACVTHERALKEAHAATKRAEIGQRRCLLDGVPISWKDLFDSKNIKTEAGSQSLAGRTPLSDCLVLRRASHAGLVCLGKTHMSELAFSGLGLNPKTQTTPCINDYSAVSGGSSSGAAGSVAFGLAAAAIGSDTGGSVRIPAAWNDLVGFKTTSGTIEQDGVVPLCPKFDTIGPLCRSVQDAAVLYEILSGNRYHANSTANNLRFMRLKSVVESDIEPLPYDAYVRAIDRMTKAGVIIEDGYFELIETMLLLAGVLFNYEAYHQWRDTLENAGHMMLPQVYNRFILGKDISRSTYRQAWHSLKEIRKKWGAYSASYDGIILPTSSLMPPNQERLLNDPSYYQQSNIAALRNTRIANMLGLCAITLPTDTPSCGLMIMLPPFKEKPLLDIAAKIESIMNNI